MTERLAPDAEGIARAANLLRRGDLVAFPTDTVYGLGADAMSDVAVARVFEAKGRPSFNPLIIHVTGIDMAERFAILPDAARAFLSETWPAPVSLVVPLRARAGLSKLATAGLESVAIRMPDDPVAQALIREVGGPVAAPSANPSGRVSPTTAAHVITGLNGKIAAVLDGGPTKGGLESTIISFLGPDPVLLRVGGYIPEADIETATDTNADAAPQAPGQLSSHYAPLGDIRLNAETAAPEEFHIGFADVAGRCDAVRLG